MGLAANLAVLGTTIADKTDLTESKDTLVALPAEARSRLHKHFVTGVARTETRDGNNKQGTPAKRGGDLHRTHRVTVRCWWVLTSPKRDAYRAALTDEEAVIRAVQFCDWSADESVHVYFERLDRTQPAQDCLQSDITFLVKDILVLTDPSA